MCLALPVSHFRNVTSSVGDDGALIRWEYWGPENNIYVAYKNKDSKQRCITSFLSVLHVGGKRRRLHLCPVQVNKNFFFKSFVTSHCSWLLPTWKQMWWTASSVIGLLISHFCYLLDSHASPRTVTLMQTNMVKSSSSIPATSVDFYWSALQFFYPPAVRMKHNHYCCCCCC